MLINLYSAVGWWTVYHDVVNKDSEQFCYQNTAYLFDF